MCHPANPIPSPLALFFIHRTAQSLARDKAHGDELARYAADPERYEREVQDEDERQANEHDAANQNHAY